VTAPAPVSVVIPAYDAERTLAAALVSALGQVPAPAEVIVVDDGSRDATGSIASSFPAVRLVRQDNQGPSAARNVGIREASQPWVAFLDADDTWLPGKLARQIAAMRRHPAAVLIAGDWVRTEPGATGTPVPSRAADGEQALSYRDLLLLNRFQTSTVLVRGDVLARSGGFDPALDGAEDWDLWLRCAKLGPVVKLEVPLVVYRDEPDGYSKDLGRLYGRMLSMLDRERGTTTLTGAAFSRVVAWHHLRFAVAFLLDRDRGQALAVVRNLRAARLLRYVPAAAAQYLAPFLGARVLRRLRG
jgi:glycosyltransferase involved in cell wall biosynthesis